MEKQEKNVRIKMVVSVSYLENLIRLRNKLYNKIKLFNKINLAINKVTGFIFLSSKITADGDCGHEIKRCLLLGRKAMTNLDSILKSRDITLPTKVHLVESMIFQVVMYGCESWTIKKAESQRIGAFELWCWTTRRSNLNPKGNHS